MVTVVHIPTQRFQRWLSFSVRVTSLDAAFSKILHNKVSYVHIGLILESADISVWYIGIILKYPGEKPSRSLLKNLLPVLPWRRVRSQEQISCGGAEKLCVYIWKPSVLHWWSVLSCCLLAAIGMSVMATGLYLTTQMFVVSGPGTRDPGPGTWKTVSNF